MKSTQLLSIVLSLILVFGVSAGPAFAQTDDDDRNRDESNNDHDIEDINDKHDDLKDKLESFCELTSDEKDMFFDEYPRIAQFKDRLIEFCEISGSERDDAIEDFMKKHIPDAKEYDLDDMLDRFCEMSEDEQMKFASIHEHTDDHIAKVNAYCELDEDERDAYLDKHEDEFRMNHDRAMKQKLAYYCELSDTDKREYLAKHDKTIDHAKKMNNYCDLDEDGRMNFIDEYRNEYVSNMKEKISDYKNKHMMLVDKIKDKHMQVSDLEGYSRYCEMTEGELILKIDDPEKLEIVSEWCEMTLKEKEDFMKERHHDAVMNLKEKHHNASDMIKEKMTKGELSPRLKNIIADKHDITDEQIAEIKMKYKEKYGDMADKKISELKTKFKDHMSSIKSKLSDEYKAAIHDRVAEMKAFKTDLREKISSMTDEEKQQLREEFIESAKDMQLAWVSPRIQMTAGVDVTEVECREGYSLFVKVSNGVPMCLKADSALKMIEKGVAVPAN